MDFVDDMEESGSSITFTSLELQEASGFTELHDATLESNLGILNTSEHLANMSFDDMSTLPGITEEEFLMSDSFEIDVGIFLLTIED